MMPGAPAATCGVIDNETDSAVLFHGCPRSVSSWSRRRGAPRAPGGPGPPADRPAPRPGVRGPPWSPTWAPTTAPRSRIRVVDAALRCIARQGTAKTTLDDVARDAGCTRATVYRVFPGGKDAVLDAVVDTEVARFFSALALAWGRPTTSRTCWSPGMTEAAGRLRAPGAGLPVRARARGHPSPPGLRPAWTGSSRRRAPSPPRSSAAGSSPTQAPGRRVGGAHRGLLPVVPGRRHRPHRPPTPVTWSTFVIPGIRARRRDESGPAHHLTDHSPAATPSSPIEPNQGGPPAMTTVDNERTRCGATPRSSAATTSTTSRPSSPWWATKRRRRHLVPDNCKAEFTWDYEKGGRPAREALREGQERPVERPDRPPLGDRGRPGAGRHGQRRGQRRAMR